MSAYRVIVIDDDPTTRLVLEKRLEKVGMVPIIPEIKQGDDSVVDETMKLVRNKGVDAAICDLTLPAADGHNSVTTGLALLKSLREHNRSIFVLAFSGTLDAYALSSLQRFGAKESFSKADHSAYDQMILALDANRIERGKGVTQRPVTRQEPEEEVSAVAPPGSAPKEPEDSSSDASVEESNDTVSDEAEATSATEEPEGPTS